MIVLVMTTNYVLKSPREKKLTAQPVAFNTLLHSELHEAHINAERFQEYIAGTVHPNDRKRIDIHLKQCTQCSEDLKDLRRFSKVVQLVPSAIFDIPKQESWRDWFALKNIRRYPVYSNLAMGLGAFTLVFFTQGKFQQEISEKERLLAESNGKLATVQQSDLERQKEIQNKLALATQKSAELETQKQDLETQKQDLEKKYQQSQNMNALANPITQPDSNKQPPISLQPPPSKTPPQNQDKGSKTLGVLSRGGLKNSFFREAYVIDNKYTKILTEDKESFENRLETLEKLKTDSEKQLVYKNTLLEKEKFKNLNLSKNSIDINDLIENKNGFVYTALDGSDDNAKVKLLFPFNTLIREVNPILQWEPIPNAVSYTAVLRDVTAQVNIPTEIAEGTSYAHPKVALTFDHLYEWQVGATIKNAPERLLSQTVQFRVISESKSDLLSIKLARLYLKMGLFEEAKKEIEKLPEKRNEKITYVRGDRNKN